MKVSIITPVLNSHEVVRRQILHYKRMELPDDVEILYIDDGSQPPLAFPIDGPKHFNIIRTFDKRPWTEHLARNKGARFAKGEYLIMIDVDYILPKETILSVLDFNGDRMNFKRRFGVLSLEGDILCDPDTLRAFGLKEKWLNRTYFPGHRSQFAIRKELFFDLGGYREDLYGKEHPLGGGAGQQFYRQWQALEEKGEVKLHEERPIVFMFPSGKFCRNRDYNPFGLFHNLPREICET